MTSGREGGYPCLSDSECYAIWSRANSVNLLRSNEKRGVFHVMGQVQLLDRTRSARWRDCERMQVHPGPHISSVYDIARPTIASQISERESDWKLALHCLFFYLSRDILIVCKYIYCTMAVNTDIRTGCCHHEDAPWAHAEETVDTNR